MSLLVSRMTAQSAQRYVALGFDTTHDALTAEAAIETAGITVVPIPTPVQIAARCGIALRLDLADETDAVEALRQAGIRVAERLEIHDI